VNRHRAADDVIAVAQALIAQGIAKRGAVFARARSAGALAVAGAAMRRPELIGGVLLDAPFLDPRSALLHPQSTFPAVDFLEFGDPRDPAVSAAMGRYSPYELPMPKGLRALVVAGLTDGVIAWSESLRWMAKLRRANPTSAHLVLRIRPHAGHGGEQFEHEALEEEALKIAVVSAWAQGE
jgi:oligopeptidase B